MGQAAFHGNVGKVEEPKFSQDGQCRIRFSVAEGHSRFDKQQNKWLDTGTTWRNVTVFGKRAETLADVLQTGAKQQVVVIGREETREYDKSDGSGKGYSFDVVADIVGIIPTAQQQQPNSGWNNQPPGQAPAGVGWGNGPTSEAPF